MADILIVKIVLDPLGIDAGPFDIYYSIDGGLNYTISTYTNVPASSFIGGYIINDVPDDVNYVKVVSLGVCTNEMVANIPCNIP